MSDTNKQRLAATRAAWRNEKKLVREGKGTRDWTPAEQREIVAKGKASNYEGHHMKSVKKYPQHAGNSQNIQFLKRSEHIDGAHRSSTKNPTNGYYDPKTKTMHSFGNKNPQAPPTQSLSQPLTQRQRDNAVKLEKARQQAAKQAKEREKQAVTKSKPGEKQSQGSAASKAQTKSLNNQSPVTPSKASTNKGIESARTQSAKAKESSAGQTNKNKAIETARQKSAAKPQEVKKSSTNKGIASHRSKASGQTAGSAQKGTSGSAQKSSSGSAQKGTSGSAASASKGSSSGSGGGKSGGQSSGGHGKGR